MNDTSKKPNPEVIFEVKNIQSAKAFSVDENFFKEELNQAKDIIKKLLKNIEDSKNNQNEKEDNHFHQHNSISVLGARGMGKTSFMLSLRDNVKNDPCLKDLIIWLPNLDPTRMEENETFLVTVVANIIKKIKIDHQHSLIDNIRDKMQSLSYDFVALAPQQVNQDQWKDLVGDPDSFAYEVLNKAHSGLSLSRSFHEFLGACLDLYGGKKVAFVQPIDDVDSAIGQGWPILETVRKYLATPYMITILSGDIDLYATLIRKQQFDKIKHLAANEDVGKVKKQVDQLTEQYLSKVMPFHLRVRLMPLTHRIMERAIHGTDFIGLKFDSKPPKPLSKIYENFLADLFNYHRPKGPEEKYKNTDILTPEFSYVRFLPDNLRDLIQLFKAFEYWYFSNKIKRREKMSQEKEKNLKALEQVFGAALHSGDITIDDLLLLKKGRHLEWLGDYCLNTRKEVQQFWRLLPQYDDEAWNQRAVLLQTFLLEGWKACSEPSKDKSKIGLLLYPQGPMSFAVKVLLPCWIAASYDLIDENLIQLKRLLSIGNTERHVYMGIRSLAYKLKDDQENWSKCGSGFVRVDGKIKIEWNKPLGWFCRRMFSKNNGLASYADMLLALARLVDVLKEGHHIQEEENTQEEKKIELENLFNLFIQNRTWELHTQLEHDHSHFLFQSANKFKFTFEQINSKQNLNPKKYELKSELIESEKDDFFIRHADFPQFDNDDKFKEYMLTWISAMKQIKSEDLLPPPIIARFWVRFMSNLDYLYIEIDAKLFQNKKKEDGEIWLEDIIKCWIKAFLLALVIEEVIFRKGDLNHSITVRHILMNDEAGGNADVFNDAFNEKTFESIEYAAVWICCPLFLLFLKDEKESIKKYFDTGCDKAPWKKTVLVEIFKKMWPEMWP